MITNIPLRVFGFVFIIFLFNACSRRIHPFEPITDVSAVITFFTNIQGGTHGVLPSILFTQNYDTIVAIRVRDTNKIIQAELALSSNQINGKYDYNSIFKIYKTSYVIGEDESYVFHTVSNICGVNYYMFKCIDSFGNEYKLYSNHMQCTLYRGIIESARELSSSLASFQYSQFSNLITTNYSLYPNKSASIQYISNNNSAVVCCDAIITNLSRPVAIWVYDATNAGYSAAVRDAFNMAGYWFLFIDYNENINSVLYNQASNTFMTNRPE
ncbi:MAG TPA: hypothetical protein DC049_07695 [Spirochaetia bacterium]|nr:hypothetical protein [Spirochaetia bacterium]